MADDGNEALKAEIRLKIVEWKNRYSIDESKTNPRVNEKTKEIDQDTIGHYLNTLTYILNEARGPDFRIPSMISSTGFLAGFGTLLLDFSLTGGAITTLSIIGFFATGEMCQRRYIELVEYRDIIRELTDIKLIIENHFS